MTKTTTAAATKTPKCLFGGCKAPVTFTVFQKWNFKTVHCCDDHQPGRRRQTPNGPRVTPITSDAFYLVTPFTA